MNEIFIASKGICFNNWKLENIKLKPVTSVAFF